MRAAGAPGASSRHELATGRENSEDHRRRADASNASPDLCRTVSRRSWSRCCAKAMASPIFAPTPSSGLTVAIVALPLSMAIAIASGVTPDRGLYTAVIGGFIVSLLGGSRFQIGGPAGAFIVLVALTVERHGVDGVILATMMAGVFLIAAGLSSARHLHQVHSLSGDGRIHRRDRRHHLRQPAQGSARHHACRQGAGRTDSETGGAWRRGCTPSMLRRSP